jgi:hypothetical protein
VGNLEPHVKANIRLGITAFFVLAVCATFTVLVYHCYGIRCFGVKPKVINDKLWDWTIAVVGTLVSLLLGIAAGLYHLNRQVAQSQESRRQKLCHMLIVELDRNRIELEENLKAPNGSGSNQRCTLTSIHPLVVEEAVKSGLFNHALTEEMLGLAKTYRKYNDHLPTLGATGEQEAETKDTGGISTEGVKNSTICVLRKLRATTCKDVPHTSS